MVHVVRVPGQIQASIYPDLTTLGLFRRVALTSVRKPSLSLFPPPPPQAGFSNVRAVLHPAIGAAAIRTVMPTVC